MDIIQLRRDHAAEYQALRLYALQESPSAFGSRYADEAGRPVEVVAERMADPLNHIFGAFDGDGRLIAQITLRRQERPQNAHKADIFGMYIHPEHRRRGLGRALLQEALERAGRLGLRRVNLSVNNDNLAAVRLYETVGFERYGLEPEAMSIDGQYFDFAYMTFRLPLAKVL